MNWRARPARRSRRYADGAASMLKGLARPCLVQRLDPLIDGVAPLLPVAQTSGIPAVDNLRPAPARACRR